jgi:hypothetical protein
VEHYADANPTVRTSNLERQDDDWRAYRERWERLGKPERDWLEKRHDDPHGTARKYWGPLRSSRTYRFALRAVPAARARAQALRAR